MVLVDLGNSPLLRNGPLLDRAEHYSLLLLTVCEIDISRSSLGVTASIEAGGRCNSRLITLCLNARAGIGLLRWLESSLRK